MGKEEILVYETGTSHTEKDFNTYSKLSTVSFFEWQGITIETNSSLLFAAR
jgi:hypothetical protein